MRQELQAVNQLSLEIMDKPESRKLGLLIWLLIGAVDQAISYSLYLSPDDHLHELVHHLRGVVDKTKYAPNPNCPTCKIIENEKS